MENREDLLNEFKQQTIDQKETEKGKESIKSMIDILYRHLPDCPPSEWTRDCMVDAYQTMNLRTTAMFETYRRILYRLMEYLVDNGAMTAKSMKQIHTITYFEITNGTKYINYYFKDLSEFKTSIEDTIRLINPDPCKDTLLTARCVLYLLWHGFMLEEIVELKKSDLHPQTQSIYHAGLRLEIPIDAECFQWISYYAFSDSFLMETPKQRVRCFYMESPYVFRTNRTEQCTNLHLRQTISYIDRTIKSKNMDLKTRQFLGENVKPLQNPKIYIARLVYMSGVFYRHSLEEKRMGIFNPDERSRLNVPEGYPLRSISYLEIREWRYREYREYDNWKIVFYSNKETEE